MTSKTQLDQVLDSTAAHDTHSELVKRLLTPAEWDDVSGGAGHGQGGNYTQTSGNFSQGSGSHSQSGEGSYTMGRPGGGGVPGNPGAP